MSLVGPRDSAILSPGLPTYRESAQKSREALGKLAEMRYKALRRQRKECRVKGAGWREMIQ